MESLEVMMKRLEKMTIPHTEPASCHCDICKDKGYTFKLVNGYEVANKCKCQAIKEIKNKMNNSGLENLLEVKTFENYEANKEYRKLIKDTAIAYIKEFLESRKVSFSILGQSGVGKTHIMSAIARRLMENNISVKYYVADEIVRTLQACKYDYENYNREFNKIANAELLFIDDLFKTSIQNYYNKENIEMNDLREIFKVINFRANKNLPILLSSEVHFERFRELDEGVVGRINEMCDCRYLISIKPDPSKNYRLNKN